VFSALVLRPGLVSMGARSVRDRPREGLTGRRLASEAVGSLVRAALVEDSVPE